MKKTVIDAVIEFTQKNLTTEIKQYFLSERKWTEETISKWKLGYFPKDKKIELYSLLSKYEIKKTDLEDFFIMNSEGNSFFKGRVIFPIADVYGIFKGITGRTLINEKPKYINSIYEKLNLLYGLNFAFKAIRKNNRAFVFEGNADVITANQFGIEESVGVQGSNLFSMEHFYLLSRYTSNIYIILDSDLAGNKAINAINKKNFSKHDKGFFTESTKDNFYRIILPNAKDPDEFLFKFGKDKFLEEVEKQKNNKKLQEQRSQVFDKI